MGREAWRIHRRRHISRDIAVLLRGCGPRGTAQRGGVGSVHLQSNGGQSEEVDAQVPTGHAIGLEKNGE